MSRPVDLNDLFPDPDPSGDFGRDEGMIGYAVDSMRDPDRPMTEIAERAARIAMVVSGRFDVEPRRATDAIVTELTSHLPKIDSGMTD